VVVIDANTIVRGPWRLESAAWRVLLHQARTKQVELIVPDLVVREAVGRFRDQLHARAAAVTAAVDKVGDLISTVPEVPPVDEDASVARYEEELRAALAEAGATVVGLPSVDLIALTQDAIDRRRPFDDKGSGFRDALLWQLVRKVAAERPGCSLALVSNDTKAFAIAKTSPPQPHPNLVADLASIDFTGGFTLFDSITMYLDSSGVDDPRLTARALQAAEEQERHLADTALAYLTEAELTTTWPGVSARIVAVEDVRVELLRTAGNDEGLLLAHFVIKAMLHIEVGFEDHATPSFQEAVSPVAMAGTATFDSAEEQFADFEPVLPLASALPEVVDVVARVDASLLILPTLTPEVLEQFRRATEFKLSPEVLEQFRRATEFKLSPEVLEQFRRATEFKLSPEVLEQFRRLAQSFLSTARPQESDPALADDDLTPEAREADESAGDSAQPTTNDASVDRSDLEGLSADAPVSDEVEDNSPHDDGSAPDNGTT
jgi:hypothetical protein